MVNYPKGHEPCYGSNKYSDTKQVIYGSRGMTLEQQINSSNTYYLQRQIAVIHKKPTPIQVVKVDYPKRSSAKITEAYYRHPSTTDYNGIYAGKYIDFEVKETKNKTRLPLSNIPLHQRLHMKACYDQGGIVFLIIAFTHYNEIFLLPFEYFSDLILTNDNKSIPYDFIKRKGYLCPKGIFPMIDYLKAVDLYLESH